MLFYGHLHIDEKCKSFDCKDLKTGAVYGGFYGQSVDFVMWILRNNEAVYQVGFWTQNHGFLGEFDFWSENFYTKKSYQHNVDNSK